MMRATDKGDLRVHQDEDSERAQPATGKASREARVRAATRPAGVSRMRTTRGGNWNVIGLTDLGGHLVERYVYTPYGELRPR